MKIYTRTGDDGTTGLLDGNRIDKHADRLDAYGTVDELSATLGLAAAAIVVEAETEGPLRMKRRLLGVQHDLFTIGSHLALPGGVAPKNIMMPPIEATLAEDLERDIDRANEQLSPLKAFILPGGSDVAARLHVARTVCRRAERCCTKLAADEPVPGEAVRYLNRLSDWLFTQARLANKLAGVSDVEWEKPLI